MESVKCMVACIYCMVLPKGGSHYEQFSCSTKERRQNLKEKEEGERAGHACRWIPQRLQKQVYFVNKQVDANWEVLLPRYRSSWHNAISFARDLSLHINKGLGGAIARTITDTDIVITNIIPINWSREETLLDDFLQIRLSRMDVWEWAFFSSWLHLTLVVTFLLSTLGLLPITILLYDWLIIDGET